MNFEIQMEFVRERNRIKYENKLMHEEDLYSQKVQPEFLRQRQLEIEKRNDEEARILQQILIQEEAEKQQRELDLFVGNYIIDRMSNNLNLDVNILLIEAENIFYERLLKKQQDEEYNMAIISDLKK